ncbi:hypothetical protein ACYSNP_05555, partial [Myroides sp. LJL110]
MKKIILPAALLVFSNYMYGQVGIGTANPNKSAELTILSSDKGVLIPNVALVDHKDSSTIANGNVESLIIYNTTTTEYLKPGYYYWNKDTWQRLVNSDDMKVYMESIVSDQITGKDGKDGKSAFDLWKEVPGNENKTQDEFLAGLIGAQGIAGSPGQSGTPGTPGEAGGPGKGVNMVVNQDGLWIYNESTGTWTNVHGKDGKDGVDGKS